MRAIVCLFLVFASVLLYGQTPLLERKISLSLQNERLEVSLKKISTAGNFVFSYNPAILDGQKIVTYNFVNKSIREILDEIFKGVIQFKARGEYIILTAPAQGSTKKEPAIVTGYVVDEATGERLKNVSVYDPVTLTSTITDTYGFFEIKIDKPPEEIILSVNRQNYSDTLVAVASASRLLNIPIKVDQERITILADSVSTKFMRFWEKQIRRFENVNMLNVDDTIYRVSQVSFVPFLGTNHAMSGNVINDYSFNILGGYAFGVRKLEIGGLFNLLGGNMKGAQFAGLFNGVGNEMDGVQFAGLMNGNMGDTQGAQFAGLLNLNLKNSRSVLFAGIGNITEQQEKGVQVAGVFNISARDGAPFQLAGVYNINGENTEGTQMAGVFNISGNNVKGNQIAGVFNVAGGQLAGSQIAGIFNVAPKVHGTQIGLINVADSVRGVPIGFMSLVWNGYHKIEISADEIFYNNLSFRTGVRQFYNIFTAGAKPSTYKEDETLWTFGYGLGTAPRLSRKLFLNLDLTANQIVQGNSIEAINLLNKLYVGVDYQASKNFSLTFGATLNGYITKKSYDSYPDLITDYQPDVFFDRDFSGDHNMKMWIGAKVGVRLF